MSLYCCYDNENLPDFFAENDRIAKKQHICEECKKTIEPGEQYRDIRGTWEGEFHTHKQCESCADLSDSMNALGYCYDYGDLKNAHAEYVDEVNQ